MAVDLARLKEEIISDPLGYQLRQMFYDGNVAGVVAALNKARIDLLEDERWGSAIDVIMARVDIDESILALISQALNSPSRAKQIFREAVTVLDVLACMK